MKMSFIPSVPPIDRDSVTRGLSLEQEIEVKVKALLLVILVCLIKS